MDQLGEMELCYSQFCLHLMKSELLWFSTERDDKVNLLWGLFLPQPSLEMSKWRPDRTIQKHIVAILTYIGLSALFIFIFFSWLSVTFPAEGGNKFDFGFLLNVTKQQTGRNCWVENNGNGEQNLDEFPDICFDYPAGSDREGPSLLFLSPPPQTPPPLSLGE